VLDDKKALLKSELLNIKR
jgi:hypothetical protein